MDREVRSHLDSRIGGKVLSWELGLSRVLRCDRNHPELRHVSSLHYKLRHQSCLLRHQSCLIVPPVLSMRHQSCLCATSPVYAPPVLSKPPVLSRLCSCCIWWRRSPSSWIRPRSSSNSCSGFRQVGAIQYTDKKENEIFLTAFPIILNPPTQFFEQLLQIPAGRCSTLIKKRTKFSLYIRKFRWDRLKSHRWGRASKNMRKWANIQPFIRRLLFIYDFGPDPFWISLYTI